MAQPVANASEDAQRDLDTLEDNLVQLKILYDKYFLGMEKLEPLRLRTEVQRLVLDLGTRFMRNTGMKYRRDQLKSKFLSYCRYWDRILKQIEEGTYKGHRVKAELHERERAEREAKKGRQVNGDTDLTATREAAPVAADGAAQARPAAPPAAAARPATPGDPVQKIFDQFVAAKKRAGEPFEGLTRDKMASVLQQQSAALKAKYQCKSVEFRVVIEDGKAKLKAMPK